ncbi:hypothetical protein Ndes2437A_g04921 [Nannochloris sp. 'desiccata']|nr:hypothetical protein KSW81_002962 [Chlorella desiccata (nom. nud.)]
MPPKGSGSQSSTLVSRGGTSGAAVPRSAPAAAATRRRSTRSTAARPGYFYAEDSSLFQLSPDQVMYFAIGFIMVVMLLHIIGKVRA